MVVRVFIDGKEVRKEDLGSYEIKNEHVKRIFAEAIGRRCVRKEDKQ